MYACTISNQNLEEIHTKSTSTLDSSMFVSNHVRSYTELLLKVEIKLTYILQGEWNSSKVEPL